MDSQQSRKISIFLLILFILVIPAVYADNLEITGIYISRTQTINENTVMSIAIKNNGPVTLYDVPYRVNTGSYNVDPVELTLSEIEPGQTVGAFALFQYTTPGQFRIRAEVNPGANEADNVKFALISARDAQASYDTDPEDCSTGELPDCGDFGCYARGHYGINEEDNYNSGCCWDDENEKFTYQFCDSNAGCVDDMNKGLCCNIENNLYHPQTNGLSKSCTDGINCYSPTEFADINNDGEVESCWWGKWRDPDENDVHCSFFSEDCTEQEYWDNVNHGFYGYCDNSLRWVTGGEDEPFGEYSSGTSLGCCGDDSGEYLIRGESDIDLVAHYTLSSPQDIYATQDGDVYVLRQSFPAILYRCSSDLSACSIVFTYSESISVYSLTADLTNEDWIYITDRDGFRKLDCSGSSCTQISLVDDGNLVSGITTDYHGNIFASGFGIIYKYNPELELIADIDLELMFTNSIAVDNNNNLYVPTHTDNRILKLDNDLTGIIEIYGSTEFGEPFEFPIDVDIDDKNNIYVSEYFGKIKKFHPNTGIHNIIWEYRSPFIDWMGISTVSGDDVYYVQSSNLCVKKLAVSGGEIKCCTDPDMAVVDGECVSTCYDGTPENQCIPYSGPQYCNFQAIVEDNCNICGCYEPESTCHSLTNLCIPSNANLRDDFFLEKCLDEDIEFCDYITDSHVKNSAYLMYASENLDSAVCLLMTEFQEGCEDRVEVLETQSIPETCGDQICSYDEHCFTCHEDCECNSYDDWTAGWDFHGQYLDWNCDWNTPFAPETRYEWWVWSSLDYYAWESDRTPLLEGNSVTCGTGTEWDFITWVYAGETFTKQFNLEWDDDYVVYVWKNCGENFNSNSCQRQTYCNNEPGTANWYPTFTRGWNIVHIRLLNDGGDCKAQIIDGVSNLLSLDERIWTMDGEGAYIPTNQGQCPMGKGEIPEYTYTGQQDPDEYFITDIQADGLNTPQFRLLGGAY